MAGFEDMPPQPCTSCGKTIQECAGLSDSSGLPCCFECEEHGNTHVAPEFACPECGHHINRHDGWGGPGRCSLTDMGVARRIHELGLRP